MSELDKYEIEKQRKEQLEHQDVLLSIASIIKTEQGQKLFKYLFKNLDVCVLPDPAMEGKPLYEYLGFLRAGNSIFKLASEAASESAGQILAKLERERYEDSYEQYRIANGLDRTSNSTDE